VYFNVYNVLKSYVYFFLKIAKQKLWQPLHIMLKYWFLQKWWTFEKKILFRQKILHKIVYDKTKFLTDCKNPMYFSGEFRSYN